MVHYFRTDALKHLFFVNEYSYIPKFSICANYWFIVVIMQDLGRGLYALKCFLGLKSIWHTTSPEGTHGTCRQ